MGWPRAHAQIFFARGEAAAEDDDEASTPLKSRKLGHLPLTELKAQIYALKLGHYMQ